jgi:hypothetical protein
MPPEITPGKCSEAPPPRKNPDGSTAVFAVMLRGNIDFSVPPHYFDELDDVQNL